MTDLIAMLRYGKRLGEPGRALIQTGTRRMRQGQKQSRRQLHISMTATQTHQHLIFSQADTGLQA